MSAVSFGGECYLGLAGDFGGLNHMPSLALEGETQSNRWKL